MGQRNNYIYNNFKSLNIKEFKQVFPWIGGDMQTIRDSFCLILSSNTRIKKLIIPVNNLYDSSREKDYLLGYLEFSNCMKSLKGIVLVTHGLGGSTRRFGLRRISTILANNGYAVFKLNLRGAGSGRYLSNSNYSARCSEDIITAIRFLRNNFVFEDLNFIDTNIPIFGLGLSLGGTILLNSFFDNEENNKKSLFQGLACVSSPLDLLSCSTCIDKPRNFIYQKWLVNRLKKQVLKSNNPKEYFYKYQDARSIKNITSIREFDEKLTAPNWGYRSVEEYYFKASPIHKMQNSFKVLPPTLLIHAKDDPWVPYEPTLELENILRNFKNKVTILISKNGGHNGFHSLEGCWSDDVVKNWFNTLSVCQ